MAKIIITGGAGFIGSHLAKYWSKQGADVYVVDNLRTGYLKNIEGTERIKFHAETIENREALEKIFEGAEYVFNMAAMISVPESLQKPVECVNINVLGIINILEAARKNKVKKVIHSSSAAVYGDNPKMPKNTKIIPEPKTPYAITKLDGEYYLRCYLQNFGLQTTSLRYFNVFGPNQDPTSAYAAAVPIFIDKAINNKNIVVYGDGEQTRDFIYVDDVVHANVQAALAENSTGVYNVALGKSTSINELADKIIKLTGSKSNIEYNKERAGDIKHSLADINNTIEEIGFSPKTNLEMGLEKTITYFKTLYEG